ncbi:MAG: AMP-binding protein [Micrococcaceae bacterium]
MVAEQTAALRAALEGTGTPVEFTLDGGALLRPEAREAERCGHPDAVAVVRTSGSTGTPKQTVLTGAGLRASAEATARRIGAPAQGAQWLLAVGTQYVAGLAVVSRSILDGTEPVQLEPGPFTAEKFTTAARENRARAGGSGFTAVSLVPTQLARLFEDGPGSPAVAALADVDAILVGGARLPEALRERCATAGLNLHLTYGMAETCGGCVYDGVPLEGVFADLVKDPDSPDSAPRLRLAGPMVAAGYLDDPERTAAHFSTGPHGPRYLSDDTGILSLEDAPSTEGIRTLGQRVQVTGRVDDVVNTGGVKVSATAVQRVLEEDPEVREAFVTGIPDDQWGQLLCAVLVLSDAAPTHHRLETRLGERLRTELGRAAVPKRWGYREALPLLTNGKTDRQALRRQLENRTDEDS